MAGTNICGIVYIPSGSLKGFHLLLRGDTLTGMREAVSPPDQGGKL